MTHDDTNRPASGQVSFSERAILTVLRGHSYDYRQKGSELDDPGWRAGMCGSALSGSAAGLS